MLAVWGIDKCDADADGLYGYFGDERASHLFSFLFYFNSPRDQNNYSLMIPSRKDTGIQTPDSTGMFCGMDWGEGGREREGQGPGKRSKRDKATYSLLCMYYYYYDADGEARGRSGKTADNATAPASGSTESKAIGRRLRREKKAIEVLTNGKKRGRAKCLLDDLRCPHRSAPGVEMEAQLANQRELGGS